MASITGVVGIILLVLFVGGMVAYARDSKNSDAIAKLAGGRFDNERTETPAMSNKPRTDTLFIVEYWHDHLSVEPLVNLLNANGFTVTNVVPGTCKTASSYPIVVCYVTKDVLVEETERMASLLKANEIDCFRVEGCHIPGQLTEIILLGSVLAFAKPGEREAAEQDALRQSAAIEG